MTLSFQLVSERKETPEPLMLKTVPPTCVMLGLKDGELGWLGLSTSLAEPPAKASLSPEALKNDCPWAAICRK